MFGLKVKSVNVSCTPHDSLMAATQPKLWVNRICPTIKAWWHTSWHSSSPLTDIGVDEAMPSSVASPIDEAAAESRAVMTALRTVGLYLAKTGFEPGKDFSVAQGKLMLNAFAFDYLKQQMQPDHFAVVVALDPELLVPDDQAAMTALEKHLEVLFFSNLRETMLVRLPTLSDVAMLSYTSRLIQGITQRHPEIKGFEQWVNRVVHEAIDSEKLRNLEQQFVDGQLEIHGEDGWVLLIDLIMAAGGQEDVHFCRTVDGVMATEKGQQLLSKLIAGPTLRIVDWA